MGSDRMEERSWVIHGQVQGVGFRWATQRQAQSLGLDGWVRNEPDGTVRLRARGRVDALESLEGWLHRGPPPAVVSEVERLGPAVHEAGEPVDAGGFRIRH